MGNEGIVSEVRSNDGSIRSKMVSYLHLMIVYDMMMMYGLLPRAEVWIILVSGATQK